jgi:hypothetical protein
MRQHRLPGAGLTRDRVQPVAEPDLGAIDEEQVLDAELE